MVSVPTKFSVGELAKCAVGPGEPTLYDDSGFHCAADETTGTEVPESVP